MFHRFLSVLCPLLLAVAVPAQADTWSDDIVGARQARRAGDYRRAKILLIHALSEADQFEDGDPRRTETKIRLAEVLLELAEYARCEQLCLESVDAVEQQIGENQLQIALAEYVLARLYLRLEMTGLADQHCRRGMEICESLSGQEDDVAQFESLMRHIWNQRSGYGKSGGARSLRTLEQSFGESGPELIVALEAVAGDCYDRWTPAYAARAVSIAESAYGERHPVYGRCLSTLATALRHMRNFDESERVSKQAIEILSDVLGPDHPELSASYRNLATVERVRGRSAQADKYMHDSIRMRFSTLSDEDLCHFYDQLMASSQYDFYNEGVSDLYLTEMTRRGGEVVQQFLESKIETLRLQYAGAVREMESDTREPDPGDTAEKELNNEDIGDFFRMLALTERYSRNLQFVTALCRIQHKPDPLQIFIDGPDELACEYPDLPDLDVTISNVDTEKREVGFTESGDYRSGRQARWRIEVTDAAGTVHDPRQLSGLIIGGGISQQMALKPEEGWQTTLTMARFVDTLEPGEYQVRVLYHNELTIVDWEILSSLIVCKSEPIHLTVRPRSIEISQDQREMVTGLLAGFDDRQTCRIIDGSYGPWAHEFISPETEYGRLLTLGWPAVPILIEELDRDGTTPRRRAHLLALLFSITGENDPRSGGWLRDAPALGRYSMLEQGWGISFNRVGEEGGYGGGFTAGPSTHNAVLDAEAQAPLIEQWQTFRDSLRVTNRD